mmetsp:Transcript_15831/g.25831  ORF Transcript_15831/g.25831 Transcript_15831/m.25831 type:complete len:315 (+) Transcript_15831:722-1666(+)
MIHLAKEPKQQTSKAKILHSFEDCYVHFHVKAWLNENGPNEDYNVNNDPGPVGAAAAAEVGDAVQGAGGQGLEGQPQRRAQHHEQVPRVHVQPPALRPVPLDPGVAGVRAEEGEVVQVRVAAEVVREGVVRIRVLMHPDEGRGDGRHAQRAQGVEERAPPRDGEVGAVVPEGAAQPPTEGEEGGPNGAAAQVGARVGAREGRGHCQVVERAPGARLAAPAAAAAAPCSWAGLVWRGASQGWLRSPWLMRFPSRKASSFHKPPWSPPGKPSSSPPKLFMYLLFLSSVISILDRGACRNSAGPARSITCGFGIPFI